MVTLVKKNNIKPLKNRHLPCMWGFGGQNVFIEKDKIENIEALYYHDFETGEYIPNLIFTLKGGITIIVDYEDIETAKYALKYYKKQIIKRVQ